MTQFTRSTPWGYADSFKPLAEGIVQCETSSHGGIWLSEERSAALAARFPMFDSHAGACWLEEDCDWSLAAIMWPEYFDERTKVVAEATVRGWHPDVWEAWKGRTLAPGESSKKDEAAFNAQHRTSMRVTAAWGDWHPGVPEGCVGVVAQIGGRENPDRNAKTGWFLVPAEEYAARGKFDFIIQPHHEEVQDFTQQAAA